MDDLEGAVAVVTGSASGLGRGMAERFAKDGMTVVVADNRLADAQQVAKQIGQEGGRATAIEVDVTSRESLTALADQVDAEFGGARVLVNNAGVIPKSPLFEAEEAGWRWIVEVNLFGVVYGVQTFLPRMIDSGRDCHIVNVASMAGMLGGTVEGNRVQTGDKVPTNVSTMYGYFATKHAVVGISEGLSRDLSGSRIGVSVLCPSHHENTGIYENSARYRPQEYGGPISEEQLKATLDEQKRVSTSTRVSNVRQPEECAARVVHAIRNRQFYIFTHPENRPAVEHRLDQIRAGLDDSAAFDGFRS